ncbi:MAG: copper resistance protein CopC [Acetobacteraceae bacterium]|jgi:methionine-rich copper-binding protein CopC
MAEGAGLFRPTKLPAGQYTVIWHVTSVDTHKTEGRFTFSVAP